MRERRLAVIAADPSLQQGEQIKYATFGRLVRDTLTSSQL
jgi:hypothetical protein